MNDESNTKRIKLDAAVLEDSYSSESEESRHSSWQNASTDWVKDSGDDWSPSTSDTNESKHSNRDVYDVEFEPESNETEEKISNSSSSSAKVAEIKINEIDKKSEDNNEVGIESSDDDNQPLVILKKRRKCIKCFISINSPRQYCHDCYMKRKDLLPPRPATKRKHNKGKQPKKSSINYGDPQPSTSKSTINSEVATEMCFGKCAQNNKVDGAFIHGKTGHQIYCYSCSTKLWKQNPRCPVCRRTIQKVVKIFQSTKK